MNLDLEGRVPTPAGFRGNLMHGECELAVPARVPAEDIARWGVVEEDSVGHLLVREWHVNPRFH